MSEIPTQLVTAGRFIKLEAESKRPEASPEGPFFEADDRELQNWIQNGGNVGLNLGDLVALDVDSDRFRRIASEKLLPTFTVRSGGGGEHRYYKCDWSGKRQFKSGQTDFGSVRSGNWYTVIPPSVHPSGANYTVLKNRPIQKIPEAQMIEFLESVAEETDSQHSGGGGGGGGCAGSSSIPEIPSEYPNQSVQWSTLRNWLSANGLLEPLNRTTSSDWSGLEFKLAKCLAEGGFSETVISDALDRLSQQSKWHNRGSDYRTRTVRKAIVAACNDDYVDFSDTGDMTGNTVESRKMEESGEGRTLRGGDNNMSSNNFDYTSKESLTVYNADSPKDAEDGDRVVRAEVTNMKGHDENGEVDTDFVTISKGTLRDNGEFGVSPEFPQDNKSVGAASPDDLRLIAEALEQIADQLED
jgi:hypothetical protein